MICRPHCGVCCTVPSISSPIPGMPQGKPAGVTCIHLNADLQCSIFDAPDRPLVCDQFQAEELICGNCAEDARRILASLE